MRRICGLLPPDQPPVIRDFAGVEDEAGGVRLWVLPHQTNFPRAGDLLGDYRHADPARFRAAIGDCAFVLYDATSRTLMLGRDAFGTTPLYYAVNPIGCAFASRIAGVFSLLPLDAAPNRRALAAFLVDHSAPAVGETYFTNVSSVPPGGIIQVRDNRVTVFPAPSPDISEPLRISFDEAVEQFGAHFRAAVRNRVDRDRPTAGLVSGGLDSAAIMCTAMGSSDVFGIHYGLEAGGEADESQYVNALRAAGLRVERVPFYPTTTIEGIETSVREGESPNIDQVTLTLQRAAACARAGGAESLLLGTWGDQVLAPFPPPHLARIAPWQRARLSRAARAFQVYMSDIGEAEIVRALTRQSLQRRAPEWLLRRRRQGRRRNSTFDILAREFPQAPQPREVHSYAESVWSSVTSPDQLEAIEGTTKWGDANGVDVRTPFLDRTLVHFLTALPDEHAYHDHALKPLLRESMRGVVPERVRARRDKGDYTAAIRHGWIGRETALAYLGDLGTLVDAGLMSRASADKVLARLRTAAEIDPIVNQVSRLAGIRGWLDFAAKIHSAG